MVLFFEGSNVTEGMEQRVKVWNEGKVSLVYLKLYEYRPKIRFYVGFWADPSKVLKYGSNGLHFAEHILWNMINRRYSLENSNASTYASGEMFVFGEAPSADFVKSSTEFVGAMKALAERKMTKQFIRTRYKVEQKRVTSETYWMDDGGYKGTQMFLANSDLKEGSFDLEYFWRIMLDESVLGRIVIVMTQEPSDEQVGHFRKISSAFTTSWDGRVRKTRKKLKCPMFRFPPISLFANFENDKKLAREVDRARKDRYPHSVLSFNQCSMIVNLLLTEPLRGGLISLNPLSLRLKEINRLKEGKLSRLSSLHAFQLGVGHFSTLSLMLSTNVGPIDVEQLRDLVNPKMKVEGLLKKYKTEYDTVLKKIQEDLV